MDGASRSLGRKGKGKAPPRTSANLKCYVEGEEKGQRITAVECMCHLVGTPGSDDESDAFWTPVHVSRQRYALDNTTSTTSTRRKRRLLPRRKFGKHAFATISSISQKRGMEREEGAVSVFMDESNSRVNHWKKSWCAQTRRSPAPRRGRSA